jgi:hypothetical protein
MRLQHRDLVTCAAGQVGVGTEDECGADHQTVSVRAEEAEADGLVRVTGGLRGHRITAATGRITYPHPRLAVSLTVSRRR